MPYPKRFPFFDPSRPAGRWWADSFQGFRVGFERTLYRPYLVDFEELLSGQRPLLLKSTLDQHNAIRHPWKASFWMCKADCQVRLTLPEPKGAKPGSLTKGHPLRPKRLPL